MSQENSQVLGQQVGLPLSQEKTHILRHQIGNVIGFVLCVVLLQVLIVNIVLIAKSYLQTDKVPDVGGYLPLIVLTDSMYPEIKSGDLIICHTVDAQEVEIGDVISFFDPAGSGTSVVTHRVTNIIREADGTLSFETKGDANNTTDADLVPAANLVGAYQSRIPGAGQIAMFMQTTTGLVICVVLPLLLLVGYDILRRRSYEKTRKRDTDALLRELEELRAQKGHIS